MILVVCLNPALDVTYHVDALVVGASLQVKAQRDRAGGKGVNVARVLHQLGAQFSVVGLAGGHRGQMITDELEAAGITGRWTSIDSETRRTVTVVDTDATVLREIGPTCSSTEWNSFVASYSEALDEADVVVLSGSLPRGLPVDSYALLIELAAARSVRVVVDTAGAELVPAVGARPYLAKPNTDEAAAAWPGLDPLDAIVAAGARNALVSGGKAGLRAVLDGRQFVVQAPVVVGNPTGAGDALTAGLAAGIAAWREWPTILCDAVAVAAGSVALPYAGGFDREVADKVRPQITIEEL